MIGVATRGDIKIDPQGDTSGGWLFNNQYQKK
jgi:hypothetical protein